MSKQEHYLAPEKQAEIQAYLLSRCRIARINGQWVKGGMYYNLTARNLIRRFAPAILVLLAAAWGFFLRDVVNSTIRWW